MSVTLGFVSMICRDIDHQSGFYREVFELPEATELFSEHFCALRIGPTILAFHSPAAIDLLGLPADTEPGNSNNSFWTFEAESDDAVGTLTDRAVRVGAAVVKAPYRTYYGAWQSVLSDPEGNVFRINRTDARLPG
ncbi:glyoxalase/bleomycin resistance/dioxygenase family protein [Gordonia desulfuricans]|uniref:Glyoxalase/bleomycin resistance/dioxygenase family protein n=1 Tax=Gordonia desulfuricans TaxID=89051 RepID=A0A7K3LNB0_9ACTN|nr:VOC family protein [Gordonia desulfuricans]NDK89725.1 glyoxalase/bleomycin resistance/dioxygenase family protein [Gordonia desulfuricans]